MMLLGVDVDIALLDGVFNNCSFMMLHKEIAVPCAYEVLCVSLGFGGGVSGFEG